MAEPKTDQIIILEYIFQNMNHLRERLSDFRRHPDYKAAFDRALAKKQDLYIEIEHEGKTGRAIQEKDLKDIFDLADKEFIEDLVRRGY